MNIKIQPVSLLSAVLRHHIGERQNTGVTNVQVENVVAELKAATSPAERLLILERVLAQDKVTGAAQASPILSSTPDSEPLHESWRVTVKSAETLNGIQPENHGRKWEAETIIRLIMEHAQSSQSGETLAGLAMPFKPTAADMAKAIEAMGYSSRQLFESPPLRSRFDMEEAGENRFLRFALIVCVGVALAIAFSFA